MTKNKCNTCSQPPIGSPPSPKVSFDWGKTYLLVISYPIWEQFAGQKTYGFMTFILRFGDSPAWGVKVPP
jgi:hypothetical protein